MRSLLSLFLIPFSLLLATGCGHLIYTSEAYRGQVLDAETQQPLVGAAVLAIWYREVPVAPHGPAVDCHDALETLTDVNGEFTVPERTHVTPIGKIREPEFVIYYPGYAPYPSRQAHPQGNEISVAYKEKYFPVALSKLKTREERIKRADIPASSKVPETKMVNLIRLVNEERLSLGLQPIGNPKEHTK